MDSSSGTRLVPRLTEWIHGWTSRFGHPLCRLSGRACRVASLGLLLLVCSLPTRASFAGQTAQANLSTSRPTALPQDDESVSDRQIRELIQGLGSTSFRARENARTRLTELGMRAFDVLLETRDDRDLEVRMAARDLLRRIDVEWASELKEEEIRSLMMAYGQQTDAERRNRVDALAREDHEEAIRSLVRISRYESQERISKYAALCLIKSGQAGLIKPTPELAAQLEAESGTSRRPAITWLKLYAETISDREAVLDRWDEVVENEVLLLTDGIDGGETDPRIVRDLIRWESDLLYLLGHRERGDEVIAQSIQLIDGSREQVVEAVDWLIDRKAWSVIDELILAHPDSFENDPFLLYHVAEVHERLERPADAERIASQAAAILGNDGRSRLEVAIHLQQRGLEKWAIAEFHATIRNSAMGSIPNTDARISLAELLNESGQPFDAFRMLEELAVAVDEDAEIEKMVRRKREPKSIASLAHYYGALYERTNQDFEAAWDHLMEANANDPTDPDVLIAMHEIPNSRPEWQAETRKRIDTATGYYRDQVRFVESQIGGFEDGGGRQMAARMLADYNNRLAWLLANTYGDSDEAMRSANRAVSLDPDNAAYFDTLSSCYLMAGDRNKALRTQRHAAKLAPYSRAILRRLAELEASPSPND